MDVLSSMILLIAAGASLYALGRVTLRADRTVRLIVGLGFLARAIAGQALFWISYLRLPIAKSLQIGEGLWFFAIDARIYTRIASAAAAGGIDDIITMDRTHPSVTYAQALSFFSLLLGNAVAVSLILNLFCYLAACVIVIRWSEATPGSRTAALIALSALSLSPSGILWSLQPLKDTFFQFLVVAFAGVCLVWQRSWRRERFSAVFWWSVAAIVALLYLIAGVRWYAGLMLLFATLLFMLLVAASLQRKRLLAAAAGLAVVFVLSRAFLLIAEPYLPTRVTNAFRLREPPVRMAAQLAEQVEDTRAGFERTGGNTAIRDGAPALTTRAPKPRAPVASTVPLRPPASTPAVTTTAKPATAKPAMAKPATAKPATAKPPMTSKPATSVPAKPATVVASGEKSSRPAETSAPRPTSAPNVSPAAPVAKTVRVASETPPSEPPSRARKFLTGAVATVLPRVVATKLGLVQIGGSGGLWLFAELDTVVFDIVLIAAAWFVLARVRLMRPSNALFWLVVAFTVTNAAGLIYTVTNFGTLFRLRSMIYTGIALIPLALATCPVRQPMEAGSPEGEPESAEPIPAAATNS